MLYDNCHHAIPGSVFDESELLSELSKNGLIPRDGPLNIISLSNNTQDSFDGELPNYRITVT
jgi:hypothetical protein